MPSLKESKSKIIEQHLIKDKMISGEFPKR